MTGFLIHFPVLRISQNLNFIRDVVACSTFAGSIFIVSNIVFFLIFGKWYIDVRSIGIISAVFMFYTLKEFDKYITKYLK